MAEITTRRQGEMVQTLFRILSNEPEGLQAKDAIARVESAMEPTPFELSTFPKNPDIVRFPKILRFSTINAVKAGWLRKTAGIWTLTDEGRAALEAFPGPEALYSESRRLYRDWKASQPEPSPNDVAVADADSDEGGLIAATTLEESEEAARRAILDYLAGINPYTLQDLVGKLLESDGVPRGVDRAEGPRRRPRPTRPGRPSRREGSADQGSGQAARPEDHRGRAPLVPVANRAGRRRRVYLAGRIHPRRRGVRSPSEPANHADRR
jgi:hypothetical protein